MFGLVKKNKDIEQLLRILEMDAANNYKDAVQVLTGLRSQYQHFTHQDQGKIMYYVPDGRKDFQSL